MLSSQCEQAVQRVSPIFIIFSDLRLGCLCQTKTIWSIPNPVWCEPIKYSLVSLSIVHIVSDRFPNWPKNRLCEHGMNCPLFCRMRHDYMVRFITAILLYWCYVIGYNVTMPGIQEALTCISWYVIRVKYRWIERHLNPWQNQVQRCKKKQWNQKTYLINVLFLINWGSRG